MWRQLSSLLLKPTLFNLFHLTTLKAARNVLREHRELFFLSCPHFSHLQGSNKVFLDNFQYITHFSEQCSALNILHSFEMLYLENQSSTKYLLHTDHLQLVETSLVPRLKKNLLKI